MSGLAEGRLYSVHIPRRALDFSRVDVIRDGAPLWSRAIAFVFPPAWLAFSRHWAVFAIVVAIVTPLVTIQINHEQSLVTDDHGRPLIEGQLKQVRSIDEARSPYASVTQFVFVAISIICALFPSQIGRIDRDLRGWRDVGVVTASSATEAKRLWREDETNLKVFEDPEDEEGVA